MRFVGAISVLGLLAPAPCFAIFGAELAPLFELVSGQVKEIQQLTESIGIAKDQQRMLQELNEGISKTVSQIQSLQAIVDRAQGLDPRSVRSLADINAVLAQAKGTQAMIEGMMSVQVDLANQAIQSSALQSDTTYRMGQEMVAVGSQLAAESQSASPGRASQITAASGSAQMLAQGVQLQTLSQMMQLQALALDFQKAQVERTLREERARRESYQRQMARTLTRRPPS